LFDDNGKLLGSATSPIQIWKDGDCIEVIMLDKGDHGLFV